MNAPDPYLKGILASVLAFVYMRVNGGAAGVCVYVCIWQIIHNDISGKKITFLVEKLQKKILESHYWATIVCRWCARIQGFVQRICMDDITIL